MVKLLGPKWLVKDKVTVNGVETETDSRILHTLALYLDAFNDRVLRGIRARLPGGGSTEDSLPYIGRDRQVARGPSESRSTYEGRLQRAIDDWRVAGTAWSVMEQIRGYCSPHAIRVRIVNEHANFYQIDRDGTRSRGKDTSWNWSDEPEKWSRFWVIIYPTTDSPQQPWARSPNWGDPELWGGAWGTPGYTWGSTATPDDVASVRKIVRTWKPAGSRCINIIIVFQDDAEAFEVDATAPPAPDGTWGNWSKNVGGVQIPARSQDAIYWDGTSQSPPPAGPPPS